MFDFLVFVIAVFVVDVIVTAISFSQCFFECIDGLFDVAAICLASVACFTLSDFSSALHSSLLSHDQNTPCKFSFERLSQEHP